MFFSPIMAPRRELTAIQFTYVDAATSSTSSVTAPGGIASGDLGIYVEYAIGNNSLPTAVTPSGFTNALNITGPVELRVMVSYKVLAGTETTITGMNAASQNSKVFVVYRPSRAITTVTPLTGASWKQEFTSGNPSSQSTTLSGLDAPVIFIGLAGLYSGTPAFSTASPAFDETHVSNKAIVGRKLYNSGPQNHTVDMSDLGFNTLVSGYIQVS